MDTDKLFNIDFEKPTPELELSVEMRCREIMNNKNTEELQRYCTNLIRHQMRQDVFLTGMLGRLAELEALLALYEMKKEMKSMKKPLWKRLKTMLGVLR